MKMRRNLILVLACSASLVAAQSDAKSRPTIAEVVEEVSRAGARGDRAGQLSAHRLLADLLALDPARQDTLGLFAQADLQREIARAIFDLGAGDPCPALDQGGAFLDQARARLVRGEEAGDVAPFDDMENRIRADRRKMKCAQPERPVEAGAAGASLTGHYYLLGVMGTGSGLLLKADGRFEWYISYGSVDQTSKGRWVRAGQTVTLVADVPSADTPLFQADEVFAWNEEAERRLHEHEQVRQMERISARCPWDVGRAVTMWSPDLENMQPATDAELATANETRRIAEAARDEASRAIAKAASATASDDDRAVASAAVDAWRKAEDDMTLAFREANLPGPDIGIPTTPADCQTPPYESFEHIPDTEWRRGVAVVIGDPAREMWLSGVEVTFVFGDGHRETTTTRWDGFAFAPVRDGTAVEQLVFALSEPVSRSTTLAIKPLAEGVQSVIVDTPQIVKPAFTVMELQVQDKDLIPQDMPDGFYSRFEEVIN